MSDNQTNPLVWVGLAIGILLVGVAAFFVGRTMPAQPGPDSADVGFLRDMSLHHLNAVEMSVILLPRIEDDEDMRAVATDILLTQQNQVGQMQALLTNWGYTIGSPEAPMAWMGMEVDGLMPGMVSQQELNDLRALEGNEAVGLYLEYMILHHESGIAMAQAVIDQGSDEQVIRLAESMVEGQRLEVALMQDMREERGFERVDIPDNMQDMMDTEE